MPTLKLRYNFVYVSGSSTHQFLRFANSVIKGTSDSPHPDNGKAFGISQDDTPTIISGSYPTNLNAGNYKITGCSWTCQGTNGSYSSTATLTIKNDSFTGPTIVVPKRVSSSTAHTGIFTATSSADSLPSITCLNPDNMKKMRFYCQITGEYFSMNASVDASVVLTITYEYLSDVPKVYINGNQITGTFMNPSSW